MSIQETLGQFDGAFETSEVSSNANIELPEGKYDAEIIDTEIFESKEGRMFLRINLKVVRGDLAGTKFTKLHSLDNPDRFKFLKGDLAVCGLMLGKLSELPDKMKEIHGVHVYVQAKLNGKYVNYYINGRLTARKNTEDVPF